MSWRWFYREWIKRTFRRRLRVAEWISGLLSLVAVPVAGFWEPEGGIMNWVPLAVFGAVFLGMIFFGLVTAPYWIAKELAEARDQLQERLAPRLNFTFDADNRAFAYMDYYSTSPNDPGSPRQVYCIGVTNRSDQTIRNVEVALMNLGDQPSTILPQTLRIKHENQGRFDLPPGKTEYVELLQHIVKQHDLLLSYQNSEVPNTILLQNYKIEIKCYGDDVQPQHMFFNIIYDDKASLVRLEPVLRHNDG